MEALDLQYPVLLPLDNLRPKTPVTPFRFAGESSEPESFWTNSLLFPAYAVGVSLLVLLLHVSIAFKLSDKTTFPATEVHSIDARDNGEDAHAAHAISGIQRKVNRVGGPAMTAFKVTRLVACLGLFSLSVVSAVTQKDNSAMPTTTAAAWPQIGQCITFAYTSLLVLSSVSTPRAFSMLVTKHLALVLVLTWAVYVYRDVWPWATFTITPADAAEGSILWVKIILLTIAAVVVPLLMPRKYIPLHPNEPNLEPNAEQTASILSTVLYSWLDHIIWVAYRTPHLSFDQLPTLADHYWTKNLVKRGFHHLDPFLVKSDRPIFWGLMKIFRFETLIMTLMLTTEVLLQLLSPLSVNRLLTYMETRGEGAIVYPWVWIAMMLFGPVLKSLAMQWYQFLMGGVLVKLQAMVTEVVFEHTLRIRVKAEVSETYEGSDDTTAAVTPEQTSLLEDPEDTDLSDTAEGGSSSNSKGKQVSRTPSEATQATPKPDRTASTESAKGGNHVGKITNLVTTDLQNIIDASAWMLVFFFETPFEIGVSIWFLYAILGWSAFVGLAVMIALLPVPGSVSRLLQSVQVEKMKATDVRVQSVTETMSVIRMVKLFGWEPRIAAQLIEQRDFELKHIRKSKLLELLINVVNYCVPVATMAATYTTYTVVMKQELTASIVFSAMTVFDILHMQLQQIFHMLPAIIQGKVSFERISEFLHKAELLDEFSDNPDATSAELVLPKPHIDESVLGLRQATFTWVIDKEPVTTPGGSRKRVFKLRIEDELIFKRGCVNLIVGPTGSGKTSLLMALLGEMHYIPSGPDSFFNLPRGSGVAYAAQESWVQDETIRDNILFGSPFDEERYKQVIDQCALKRDLSLFDAGDATEVGEKGVTLSGGQKARITLARAVYSRAEILLLDDVLAALDVHTARWIVEKCFKGNLLRGRTIILVTHNIALASPIADFVVSLGSDGRVLSQGSLSNALDKDAKLSKELAEEAKEMEKEEYDADELAVDDKVKKSDGKLVIAEEIEMGHVGWSALKLYIANLGEHPIFFWIVFLATLSVGQISMNIQIWFLGYWASQYEEHHSSEVSVPFYLSTYCLFVLVSVILYALGYLYFVIGSLKASKVIHQKLITSVLGTTLRWLDQTPTSRIVARCTEDINAVDGQIARGLLGVTEISAHLLLKVSAVVLMTPIFLIPAIVVGALGGLCGQIYMKAQLPVKREMSNTRAPLLGHIGSAITGLTSIRAYGAQKAFIEESYRRIDRYTRASTTCYNLNRWVTIRVDLIGALFSSGLAAYLTYVARMSASDTGFSLNMAAAFSGSILWWVRTLNMFEVSGNSLERVQQYLVVEQEAKPTESGVPPAYWPASGDLRVEKLSARYSSDGPKVLHDISFEVKSGERVGIVGRTGSGKSSLTLSLLRCILTEGKVSYDGIPTDTINLDALRSKVTIIPQVPELMSGTIRQNLDPFSQHDDAVLNDALRSAGLFSLQNETEEARITLDSQISGGGGNLSVGQRQILALARAIVRQSKLLILDEATSAIDYETDTVIQRSLRTELDKDVTLLTVAHRLQTIMDADKIMVLDEGRIVEFDKPSELLKNEKGMLRALVDESGDKESLYVMASGASSS